MNHVPMTHSAETGHLDKQLIMSSCVVRSFDCPCPSCQRILCYEYMVVHLAHAQKGLKFARMQNFSLGEPQPTSSPEGMQYRPLSFSMAMPR